ncbi:response regulator transcription factor [Segetibacter koreensis]|uniref:response regulator transcription factor n=1 Tax=Segetibacter koreensis TaxID=398037 RepID=UPI000525ED3B|nr:response regulator transcription factor [Segetibacter koreensis]
MIKVAVIEDNPQYRTTISIILQLNENLKLIHKLEGASEMVPLFEVDKPDVVLMDIDLPVKNGIQATWEIKKIWPEMKILMLTVFEDDDKIFGAIKAGANGYLLKKDSPQKILDAIEALYNGEAAMNGIIASKMLEYFQKQQQDVLDMEETNLTAREKNVLQLLVKGLTYKEIAGKAFISIETLNSHIKNIYRKLNVHSRAELTAKYGHIL